MTTARARLSPPWLFRIGFGGLTALMALALLLAPAVGVYPVFVMKALCFALFACAFNLLIGFGGLLSFGHAMFFGGGAYFCGYAAKTLGWPPEVAIIGATAATSLVAVLVGAIAIRRQGIYFAMTTLALAQLAYFIFLQAPFTHGEDGIQSIPRGRLLGFIDLADPLAVYYVVVVVFLAAFLCVHRIVHSSFGHVLVAIRDNEPRAISLGYDVARYKLICFVLSATLAGLAGSMKAIVFQLASLNDVHWTMSGEVVLMTLVGGIGTLFGPVVGAFVIVAMHTYLASLGQWVTFTIGLIFVLCVLGFRKGIVGVTGRWLSAKSWRTRTAEAEE